MKHAAVGPMVDFGVVTEELLPLRVLLGTLIPTFDLVTTEILS